MKLSGLVTGTPGGVPTNRPIEGAAVEIFRVDPETGERYADVIVFWVASEADKHAMVQDDASPFFTTAHFDGHPSVLLRASRIGDLSRQELAEVVHDAWLSRASARRAAAWLSAHPPA